MDEGLLHLPSQMNEWLISGTRIAGMNVWRWALADMRPGAFDPLATGIATFA